MAKNMTSVTLTNERRDTLENRIINHAFEGKRADLYKAAHSLALKAIEYRLGDEWKLYNSIPDGWLKPEKRIYVRVAGQDIHLELDEWIRVPCFMSGLCAATFDRGHVLGEQIEEHHAAVKALREERKGQKAKVHGVLHSCRTTRQLLDAWPEVAALIPAHWFERETAVSLPATTIADLNASLGLPPEQQAA